MLLGLVDEPEQLRLVLRLLDIDEIEVDLVALEHGDRAPAPRAALLAEHLRLDARVAEADHFALRLGSRRRCCDRGALGLGLLRHGLDLGLRRVVAAEQLRHPLARADVARIVRELVGDEVAQLAAELVGAVERGEHLLGRLLGQLLVGLVFAHGHGFPTCVA